MEGGKTTLFGPDVHLGSGSRRWWWNEGHVDVGVSDSNLGAWVQWSCGLELQSSSRSQSGLPMWELSDMFTSYKRLLNVPPRTNLAFLSSSQIFQSQSVILLSDIFEVKASIWNLQASCLQSLWSCGVSVQPLQLTLSTLLPMTGRSWIFLISEGPVSFSSSCQIKS